MTEYITYLPYMDRNGKMEAYGHEPLIWLYKNFRGKFKMADAIDHKCTIIYFDHKEDMELFILMWGEYLWSKDALPNL